MYCVKINKNHDFLHPTQSAVMMFLLCDSQFIRFILDKRPRLGSLLFLHNHETRVTEWAVIHHVETLFLHGRIHTAAQKTAPGEKGKKKVTDRLATKRNV